EPEPPERPEPPRRARMRVSAAWASGAPPSLASPSMHPGSKRRSTSDTQEVRRLSISMRLPTTRSLPGFDALSNLGHGKTVRNGEAVLAGVGRGSLDYSEKSWCA